MSPFWTLARRMLRYRLLMTGSLVMAVAASASLSAGLIGAKPVIDGMVGSDRKNLQRLATEWNGWLAENARIFDAGSTLGDGLRWIEGKLAISGAVVSRLPDDPFVSLAWILGGLAMLATFGAFVNFLHAYLAATIVNRTITGLRREMFHSVVRAPLYRVVRDGASDAVSRIVNDTTALSNGFQMLLSKAVLQVLKGVAGLVVAIWADWRVTLGAALVAPILYTVIRKLGKRIKRGAGRALESQSMLYGAANEALTSLRSVKVNTGERLAAGQFHRINKQVMFELNRIRTARALASPLTELLTLFLLCGLTLLAGHFILHKDATIRVNPGDLVLVLSALAVAGASLKPLTGIVNDIQAAAPAADRIAALMDASPEPGHDLKLPRLARHRESIEFRGVTFTYRNAVEPALRGVSLKIPHGLRVAVVGPNGCGKTSLLSLVPRLFDPQDGQILIDGHDIRDCSVRSLRSQIGVVTQETILFRGTIRSNIAYGAEGATDGRIIDAAKRARAYDFIGSLPRGFETPIAEQGLSLSGGQRQRIAIARAILRDPAILILDEATSMIDAESEAHIAAALAEFSAGRTTLTVAHRLATVINADLIVVMDGGRIIDTGTHAELFGRNAIYQTIVQHQLGGAMGASFGLAGLGGGGLGGTGLGGAGGVPNAIIELNRIWGPGGPGAQGAPGGPGGPGGPSDERDQRDRRDERGHGDAGGPAVEPARIPSVL